MGKLSLRIKARWKSYFISQYQKLNGLLEYIPESEVYEQLLLLDLRFYYNSCINFNSCFNNSIICKLYRENIKKLMTS